MNNLSITNFSDMFNADGNTKKSQNEQSGTSTFLAMFQQQMSSSLNNNYKMSSGASEQKPFQSRKASSGIGNENSKFQVKETSSFNDRKIEKASNKVSNSSIESKNKYGKQEKKELSKDETSTQEARDKLEELRESSENADFWQQLDDDQAMALLMKLQTLNDTAKTGELSETLDAISEVLGDKADLSKDISIISGQEQSPELTSLVQGTAGMDKQANENDEQASTDETETTIDSQEAKLKNSGISELKNSQNEQLQNVAKNKTANENAENEQAKNTANTQTENVESTQTGDAENTDDANKTIKANKKIDKGNQKDLNAQVNNNKSTEAKSENAEVKSLRSEFAEKTAEQVENAENVANTNEDMSKASETSKETAQGTNRTFTLNSDKLEYSNELKQKIVDAFFKQNSNGKARPQGTSKSFTYAQKISSGNKSSFSNNSNGNGSGYGSNNPSYQLQGNKLAQTQTNNPTTGNLLFTEILEKAEMLKTSAGQKIMNVELSPDGIGKMTMRLMSKDGGVSAKISAEDVEAKEKLDKMIPEIKDQLKEQGINISEINVDIFFRQPDGNGSNKNNEQYNKSERTADLNLNKGDEIIRKNILPHLRRSALNIQAIDLTV